MVLTETRWHGMEVRRSFLMLLGFRGEGGVLGMAAEMRIPRSTAVPQTTISDSTTALESLGCFLFTGIFDKVKCSLIS